MAYELAAYFHVELGDTQKSMEYFSQAHLKYHEWGAFGKCDSLSKFIEITLIALPTGAGVSLGQNSIVENMSFNIKSEN